MITLLRYTESMMNERTNVELAVLQNHNRIEIVHKPHLPGINILLKHYFPSFLSF